MMKREITIEAASREEAVAKATAELGSLEDNMSVEQLPDGAFHVALVNAPADVEIEISRDKMKAFIRRILPPLGEGPALTEDKALHSLQEAGVIFGIDQAAIRKIVESALDPSVKITNAVVAAARPPDAGQNASIEKEGDHKYAVLPGMVVAKKIPLRRPTPGQNVCGEEMPAKKEARDINLVPGTNVAFDSKTLEAKATAYGKPEIEGQRVVVKEYIKMSDDKLRVVASVQAKLADGSSLRTSQVLEMLAKMNVAYGIKEEAIREAILKSEADGAVVEAVTIAEGDIPVFGTDASFEYLKGKAVAAGADIEGGRIDYRERGLINNVTAGELLVKKIPATPGKPGKTVTGEVIQAANGEDKTLVVDQNVEVSKDGLEFLAKTDGLMIVRRNSIGVCESYRVDGNVDYSTGNIRVKKGAVHIRGGVCPAFTVKAGGDVIVEENIEDARVESDGALFVSRGILHREFGYVKVKGDVTALFAENARIEAEGSINIKNNASNCQLKAGKDVVVMEGKGKIIGGTVVAGGSMEAKDIGCDLGTKTSVIIGMEYSTIQELEKQKEEFQQIADKITGTLGRGEEQDILKRFPITKRPQVKDVLKARSDALEKVKGIEGQIASAKTVDLGKKMGTIKIHGRVYPGTVVRIADRYFNVEQPIDCSELYYDMEQRKIAWRRLG